MKAALTEKRYADCADFIERIILRDSQNYDAMLERGELRLAEGDAVAAVDELKKDESVYPRSAQMKYQLALAFLKIGDIAKAEDRLRQAVLLEPSLDLARLTLAEIDLRKGTPAAAIAELTGLIERQRQMGEGYLLLAQAYIAEQNPDQALATYRKMARAFPLDPQAHYLIGRILAEQNHPAEARAAFEKALQVAPGYVPALDRLVDLDLTEHHVDTAAARVRALLAQDPKSSAPWLLQAKVDLMRNDSAATESDLLKAIELDPKGQAGTFELAQLYIATRRPAQAVERLTALTSQVQNQRALMLLGTLHSSLNEFEAARDDYERVLSFEPKCEPALNDLAYLYSEHLGNLDLAYNLAKQARDAAPDDANAADTLGWILYRKGDYKGALDLVQECAQKQPENVTAQYHIGMIHYMRGEQDLAKQAFLHAVALAGAGSQNATAEDARRRLALLALDPARADVSAVADLHVRMQADPNDPIVLLRLAAVEARTGASAEAAAHFEATRKLTPPNPDTMLELAQLYAGPLHDPVAARALAKSAHDLAPNNGHISETLGRLLYQTGDFQWSMDLLQEALLSLHDDPDVKCELAFAEYGAGHVSAAEDALSDLIGGNREFQHRDQAQRLLTMIAGSKTPERIEASLPEVGKILAGDPDYIPAQMIMALSLEERSNPSGAATAYEHILADDPLFSPAARQLALIYSKQFGGEQRAYEMATKARAAFPNDPDLATVLGIIEYRRRDYVTAIHFFEDSKFHRSNDSETIYYLGMAHYQMKARVAARAELERALELSLVGPEADQAKRVLDELKRNDTGTGSNSVN